MNNTYTDEFLELSPAIADPGAAAQANFEKTWARLYGRTDVAYAASIEIDFANESTRVIGTLSGNLTLTTANLQPGRSVVVIITADGSSRNFTLPAWIPQGSALPASIAANKKGTLTLFSDGTTDAEVRAIWQVQP